ncbi:putative baseplate assembly protein [Nocardioides guangzhouensis]|uniref:Putative baseplate assembly protein n=1 Tax=Nocardioides guangzhouensis TaxID=2497878 RepID=A0A4Q4Z6D1_9ACTN|nr:putative baseplate assembly protein [Nocardioides guangzhouensis]RYP83272.1 putative baseplate assembly protein [Nocardioides guangzhouensis]
MLPAPNLDDRTFQGLVDEAKRLVQTRCPEWTDHNVSDPGVTLIEAFAQMVDQLIYRLNRVPDLNYVKFLEMIGVELRPPAAATGRVTLWLSAPQPQRVLVRSETQVATPRTDIHDPIVFSTLRDLEIVPCSFNRAGTALVGAEPVDLTAALSGEQGFAVFSPSPTPGDALLIGLSNAVPSCAVTLRMECTVSGVGVDPRRPPRVWEAWTGTTWSPCEVDHDDTGGLNKDGDVVLHVPDDHQASIIARERAGWLRCRLVEALPDQPTYTAPPRVNAITAFTIGGTVPMENAEVQHRETLGTSDGTPGQRFPLLRRPVLASPGTATLEVTTPEGEQVWTEVRQFAESAPEDLHFRLDHVAGEVQFGPAVRLADGSLRHYGAVPPRSAGLLLTAYRSGGGRRGNVTAGQVRVLKTSVPYVARVENRAAVVGGSDAETLEDAKVRGPMLLRARGRAVTAEDFVQLARDVAPEAARVHCAASREGDEGEGVLVLVVPNVAGDHVGRVRRDDLAPEEGMLQRIAEALDACRLVGTRVLVAPPRYSGLTVVADVHARERYDADVVHDEVLRALYGFLDPLTGGPDGTGWPFGRSVQSHEVHAALARIPGVDMAQEVSVTLFPADPRTGRRQSPVQRLDLPATGLVYSYEHQVRVQ